MNAAQKENYLNRENSQKVKHKPFLKKSLESEGNNDE
jgi:hypothetical protein